MFFQQMCQDKLMWGSAIRALLVSWDQWKPRLETERTRTELCEGHKQLWNDLGDETLNLPIIYLVDDSDKQFYCPILRGKHVEPIRLHQNKKEKYQINTK